MDSRRSAKEVLGEPSHVLYWRDWDITSETVDYEEVKELALDYYIKVRDSLPLPMRDMPRKVVANTALSVNAIIAAIESNTEIGQWLVAEYASGMGLVVSE